MITVGLGNATDDISDDVLRVGPVYESTDHGEPSIESTESAAVADDTPAPLVTESDGEVDAVECPMPLVTKKKSIVKDKKKKNKLKGFTNVALAEEVTRQKELDLKILQMKTKADKQTLRGRLEEKKQERRLEIEQKKLELVEMKMRMKHEYSLKKAAMRLGLPLSSSSFPSSLDAPDVTPSYLPLEHTLVTGATQTTNGPSRDFSIELEELQNLSYASSGSSATPTSSLV